MINLLRRFPNYQLKRIPLLDAVGREMTSIVTSNCIGGDRWSWKRAVEQWLSGKTRQEIAEENIFIFVLTGTSEPEGFGALQAFPLSMGGYIFLRDMPHDLKGSGRFAFLHELGHISAISNYYPFRSMIGAIPFYFAVIWQFFQHAPRVGFSLAETFWFLTIFFLTIYWSAFEPLGDLQHEMRADFFAIASLDEPGRQKTAAYYRKYPTPYDNTLAPALNEMRRKLLLENLNSAVTHGVIASYPISGRTPLPVWVALGATVIMAFYSKPQDVTSIFIELLTGITVWLWFFFHFTLDRGLKAALSLEIANRATREAVADVVSVPSDVL